MEVRFIGGLAVQNWGETRFTRHLDLILLTGFGNEEAFIDPLLNAFAPRMEWATGDRHFLRIDEKGDLQKVGVLTTEKNISSLTTR